ncbi:Mitochondrial acidic protein mam33, partial [Lobulomyces angularis]
MLASRFLKSARSFNAIRSFTVTSSRFAQGKSDAQLCQSLRGELEFEKNNVGEGEPDWLAEFKKNSPWKISDKLGHKEVHFVSSFGNEKITAVFNTDSISEAAESYEELEENLEGAEEPSRPVSFKVLIEKNNGKDDFGALEIDTSLQEDTFYIDNISFNKSSKVITEDSAEAEFARLGHYAGPVFGDLEEAVQEEFATFLEERGFNEQLAQTVPRYLEFKEQKEYMNWLEQVSEFIS